ncbi:unnamed protein product [Adineta steineri]|uniref:Uncharacterized protein n=1 Tax=Adineta steineri TaxID=433720 RepID=A0A814G836_9BILA|nr:unnamed protein product [Adineta steineri]
MSPEHFHYRLPFFAKVNSDTNVTINSDMQDMLVLIIGLLILIVHLDQIVQIYFILLTLWWWMGRWWNFAIQSGGKVVIPLPTGWDPRPRSEHSVPWVDQGPEHFLQPTAKELQNFFQSSIQLTCINKNITETQTVIVYAWNENSENGTYYINALSEILPMSC